MKLRYIVLAILSLFLIWLSFYTLFVLPSPFFTGDPVTLNPSGPVREIVYDLIDHIKLDDFEASGAPQWVRKDLQNGGLQVSLGKYMWLVESRRAVGASKPYQFLFTPDSSSVLHLGMGISSRPARFRISINGKGIYDEMLFPAGEKKSWLFNNFFKFFHFRFFNQKGYWKDVSIPLKQWQNQQVSIELSGDSGYWSSPVITNVVPDKTTPPNIIVIQIDALRSDIVNRGKLPFINRIRKEGFHFSNAFSNGNWTRPSNTVQFFGRYNCELGLNTHDLYIHPLERQLFYRNRFPSLPVLFSQKGYRNAAIGDNIFIHGFSEWGADIGFCEVKDYEKMKYESVYIVDDTMKWIERQNGVPFFLFLDFNQTHMPYKPSIKDIHLGQLIRNTREALFTGCARYVDRFIEKLWIQLENSGHLENTIIIINADHGENFNNFGREYRWWDGSPVKVREHGYSLWADEIAVPIIFYWKDRISPGSSDIPVSLMDIPPTLLSLCRQDIPETFAGRDLSPYLLGQTHDIKKAPVIVEGRKEISIIDFPYQFIARTDTATADQLYNIQNDPLCRKNLIGEFPLKGKQFREKLMAESPGYYPLLVIEHQLGEGEEATVRFGSRIPSFWGSSNGADYSDEQITLTGKGYFYTLLDPLPETITVTGTPLYYTDSQVRYSKETTSTIFLDQQTIQQMWSPRSTPPKKRNGAWIYITPVISFVKNNRHKQNNATVGEGMKQLMIDWGYMKK